MIIKAPQNITAEKIVLASSIHSEQAREDMCTRLTEQSFYARENKALFNEIKKAHTKGYTLDYLLVEQAYKDKSYLAEIWWSISTQKNIKVLISKLQEAEKLRDVLEQARKITHSISNATNEGDYTDAIEECQGYLSSARDLADGSSNLRHISTFLPDATREFNSAQDGTKGGLKTGIDDLDNATGGFFGGEYIVIAGRPSSGKSSLGLSILKNFAMDGNACGFFSIEMGATKVVNRVISMVSSTTSATVEGQHLRGVKKADENITKAYMEAQEKVASMPLYFDDNPRITMANIESSVRSFVRKNNLKAVCVDYISLVNQDDSDKARKQRWEQVSDMSKRFQALFKDLGIVGIVLVQLSRDAQNAKPMLNHLRESGQIEQDANMVIAIHRPDLQNKSACEIGVLKARDGGDGDYLCSFSTQTTEFKSMTYAEKEMYKESLQSKPSKVTF